VIYLDSAATSLMKPDSVHYAVIEAMQSMASPGRGSHEPGMRAADICYECRENIASLFGMNNPENVVFTFNATHGLNIAVNSLVRRGSRVLVSGYEHNSVMRPLHAQGAIVLSIGTKLFDAEEFISRAEKLIRNVDVVVCTAVSNVFGYVLPIDELAEMCRRYGKRFVIDASQSAGVIDMDFPALGADFAAMPGHKGLLGPQGTGVLLCKNEAKPLLYGGSGSMSRGTDMPDFLPDRLEAGTHNVCGIAGLNAGVKYLLSKGVDDIRRHERSLLELFVSEIQNIDGLRLFFSDDERRQSSVISVLPENISCEELGQRLSVAGVAVRTGLHCAPAAHHTAGTEASGTVRFSFSPFNSAEQVSKAAEITKNIIKIH